MGGYDPLKAHSFFKGIEWETLDKQKPPELHPYLPAKGADTEYWSQYKVMDKTFKFCFRVSSNFLIFAG